MDMLISPRAQTIAAYSGPDHLALADWRRRISDLYAKVRKLGASRESWMHWHHVRSHLLRHHPMTPLPDTMREGFEDIPMFDYNPRLRFEVTTDPAPGPAQSVDLGQDGVLRQKPIARTKGLADHLGAELTLYWIGGYGGGQFLPFKDATSGHATYGGGRYLLDAIKGADLGQTGDGRLILDFNFAYHPSCATNPAWVCPLSPEENTLPTPVRAGEMLIP